MMNSRDYSIDVTDLFEFPFMRIWWAAGLNYVTNR